MIQTHLERKHRRKPTWLQRRAEHKAFKERMRIMNEEIARMTPEEMEIDFSKL